MYLKEPVENQKLMMGFEFVYSRLVEGAQNQVSSFGRDGKGSTCDAGFLCGF